MDRCDTRKVWHQEITLLSGPWDPNPALGLQDVWGEALQPLTPPEWEREKKRDKRTLETLQKLESLWIPAQCEAAELWEQTMPLLWHGKVDTAGRDPQRNNRMWIRTFLWCKKLKPTKYRRLALTLQTLPRHTTNCHLFATETFVIPAGVGPQDKFLIKLATKSYCVVKADIPGKIRGSDNATISLFTTTTSLKGTKNLSFSPYLSVNILCAEGVSATIPKHTCVKCTPRRPWPALWP